MLDPNNAMAKATRAFQSGNFETARTITAQLAVNFPGNPQVLQLLGLAQTHTGDARAGFETLRRAMALAPQNAQIRFNAANAMLSAGKAAEALEIASNLPADPPVLHLRALAAKAANRLAEAKQHFATLVQKSPTDTAALNNYGNFLNEIGDSKQAVSILQRAKAADPKSPQVLLNLGRALDANLQPNEALKEHRAAVSLKPTDLDILFQLAKSLIRLGQHAEALPLLNSIVRKGEKTAELLTLTGISEIANQQHSAAEQAFEQALAVEPHHRGAILNFGIMLEQANRHDELRQFVDKVADANDAASEVAYLRALLLRREKRFEEALEIAQTVKTELLDEALLAEFIGKLHDRLGNADEAFASFSAMNVATSTSPAARRIQKNDGADQIVERIALLTRDWHSRFSETPSHSEPAPVFLGGFLRSGTTLLDTILMGHPDTEVREEEGMIFRMEDVGGPVERLPSLDARQISTMRSAYFAEALRTKSREPDSLLIDKNPLMTLWAAHIHRAFPIAKFVFTLRHPCDVVLSCFMQNFQISENRISFLDLRSAASMYAATMAHWERCREVMPLDVHTIRYEDMVVNLEQELRSLVAFLGLNWNDGLLDHQRVAKERGHIRTPSYSQVTEEIYTRSSGRWQKYREHLDPVLPVLAPWVEKFGYDPI